MPYKVNYDIDLVYLWVNGDDEKWSIKKDNELAKYHNVDVGAVSKCRFCDNDELKYSLRSAEKFAPWINKIHIVTDNQIPGWLDAKHPKISMVDHKNIMPPEALPCFNSLAIETCLAFIPGLSEHFLYANDDVFFGDYVNKEFFFDKNGAPIIRVDASKTGNNNLYCKSLQFTREKVIQKFGKCIENSPHHNIDAYRKSDIKACLGEFEYDINNTLLCKFRKEDNIARMLFYYYAIEKKIGRWKQIKKIDEDLPLFKKIKNTLLRQYSIDSIYIFPEKIHNVDARIKKLKPKLFCINDSETTTAKDRADIKKFLEEYFPQKSSYEI